MLDTACVKPIRQLHIVATSGRFSGGEGLAALRFSQSIALAGSKVILLARKISDQHLTVTNEFGQFAMQTAPSHRHLLIELLIQYQYVLTLCRREPIDLVHIHGMWTPFLGVACLAARKLGIPIIISPHGSLDPWPLAYKRIKKWLALRAYQEPILRSATLFIVTAQQELESVRRLGLKQPVAVIPNGVDVESPPLHGVVQKAVKNFLFLSRIHPVKGLHDLIEAWSKVPHLGWRITIAGADDEGYRVELESLVRAKGLKAEIDFVGYVEGAQKKACFEAADVFILPTYSENFGIAIAEALANELPVITTTGAPWSDLIFYRCGWWVKPGVQGISSALLEAMNTSSEELREMGKRGRQLIIEKYSWRTVGAEALEISEWLLDRSRSKPKTVDTYSPMV